MACARALRIRDTAAQKWQESEYKVVQADAAGREGYSSPESLQGSSVCLGAMPHMFSLPATLAATLTNAARAAAGAARAAALTLQGELLMCHKTQGEPLLPPVCPPAMMLVRGRRCNFARSVSMLCPFLLRGYLPLLLSQVPRYNTCSAFSSTACSRPLTCKSMQRLAAGGPRLHQSQEADVDAWELVQGRPRQ